MLISLAPRKSRRESAHKASRLSQACPQPSSRQSQANNDNTLDNTNRNFTSHCKSSQAMSSNANSRNSPSAGGNGSGGNNDRPRLTDAEKKQNHIISEQKRRQAIRQGFDRLAAMTPGMAGMGRSEAAVLNAAVGEIKTQTDLKARLKRKIMSENPSVTSEWFEAFYEMKQHAPNASTAGPVNNNTNTNNVTTPNASTAGYSSGDSHGSTSKSKGKGKRVKKE